MIEEHWGDTSDNPVIEHLCTGESEAIEHTAVVACVSANDNLNATENAACVRDNLNVTVDAACVPPCLWEDSEPAPKPIPKYTVDEIFSESYLPHSRIDRYELKSEIAHGGMATIFLARDLILARTVALKVMHPHLRDSRVAQTYFLREARASAQLQHTNIVTVYDIGKLCSHDFFISMELIDGDNLRDVIARKGPLSMYQLLQVGIHAARGLQFAHEHGVIHRDVKPRNMMVARGDGTLKILDFGLAKIVHDDFAESESHVQAMGTPFYMSPEQFAGTSVDARSDIYSYGVTLFELATGSLPFKRGDMKINHLYEKPPRPSILNPEIPVSIETIILKCMEKDPADRFSSCAELIQTLRACYEDYR